MRTIYGLIAALLCCAAFSQAESGELDAKLEGLKPFLGQWRGEFKDSTPEKPVVDVALWERALNGKAVRILHSINDGAYGGETLVVWDAGRNSIVYHYFTTAGFQTKGAMSISGHKLVCREEVSGNTNGITEVKSTYELTANGTLVSAASYLKNGEWMGGREITYKRDSAAKVLFK